MVFGLFEYVTPLLGLLFLFLSQSFPSAKVEGRYCTEVEDGYIDVKYYYKGKITVHMHILCRIYQGKSSYKSGR